MLASTLTAEIGMSAADKPRVRILDGCTIERVVYPSAALNIVGWIVRPIKEGIYPVLVWNHEAQFNVKTKKYNGDKASVTRCFSEVRSNQFVVFAPEGRGYAGSDGPNLKDIYQRQDKDEFIGFLEGRAADVSAGVRWLKSKPYVDPNCFVIAGYSHGGVVSILAGALDRYRAILVRGTGTGVEGIGLSMMKNAMDNIDAPILFQQAEDDTVVDPKVSSELAKHAKYLGKPAKLYMYEGIPGQEGHGLFRRANFDIWGLHYWSFLKASVRDCRIDGGIGNAGLSGAASDNRGRADAGTAIELDETNLGVLLGRWRGIVRRLGEGGKVLTKAIITFDIAAGSPLEGKFSLDDGRSWSRSIAIVDGGAEIEFDRSGRRFSLSRLDNGKLRLRASYDVVWKGRTVMRGVVLNKPPAGVATSNRAPDQSGCAKGIEHEEVAIDAFTRVKFDLWRNAAAALRDARTALENKDFQSCRKSLNKIKNMHDMTGE